MNPWIILLYQEAYIGYASAVVVWEYLLVIHLSQNNNIALLISDTDGGGFEGAKGGATVVCAALCETAVAIPLGSLTLSGDITLSGS